MVFFFNENRARKPGHEAVISKAMFRFLSRAALWLQRNQKGEGARKLERHGPEGKPVRENLNTHRA
jgi:hypothetical protein